MPFYIKKEKSVAPLGSAFEEIIYLLGRFSSSITVLDSTEWMGSCMASISSLFNLLSTFGTAIDHSESS